MTLVLLMDGPYRRFTVPDPWAEFHSIFLRQLGKLRKLCSFCHVTCHCGHRDQTNSLLQGDSLSAPDPGSFDPGKELVPIVQERG
jgi:hypothetical protein